MNSQYSSKFIDNPVVGKNLEKYFQKKTFPIAGKDGFYLVEEGLSAFKNVRERTTDGSFGGRGIVNLIIPKGAVVFAPASAFDKYSNRNTRKMRASFAKVESIVSLSGLRTLESGESAHRPSFVYKPDATVSPRYGFDTYPLICSGGIHFFLNVGDAYYYR